VVLQAGAVRANQDGAMAGAGTGGAMRRRPWLDRYGLLLLALAIFFASLAPGTVTGSWSEVVAELRQAALLHLQEPILVTILERALTFAPLGAMAYRELRLRGVGHARLVACLGVLLFATSVELAQGAIQGRHARLSDLILAVAFGAGGVEVGAWIMAGPTAAKVRRLLLAAVLAGNAIILIVVTQAEVGARPAGWDCSYPLLLANELSGDRPWLGRLRGLALYPRSLTADEVRRLTRVPLTPENISMRRELGALALYSFAKVEAGRVPQLLEDTPGLDLLLPPPESPSWQMEEDAIDVRAPTLIRSAGPPSVICEAIMASQAFAVEVEIASSGIEQGGPARIVSQSSGILERNFTLGEELGSLVARVRTPWNGRNGTNVPLVTDSGVLSDGWHRIVFGQSGGALFLFLDGVEVARLPYHTMILLGDGWVVRIAVVAGLLFAAMGAIASLMLRPRSWLIDGARVYGTSALLPVVVLVGLAIWFGHAQDRLLLAAAAFGPGIGMLVARALTAVLAADSGSRDSPLSGGTVAGETGSNETQPAAQ
jgi:hypothetical protein